MSLWDSLLIPERERDQLRRWVEHKPLEEWKDTRYQRNALTVDGQPGLVRPDQD